MDSNRRPGCGLPACALIIVIGGLVGAGLAFLCSSRGGKETREKIKAQGRKSLEKLRDTLDSIWGESKRID